MSSLRVLDLPADQLEGEVAVAFYFTDCRPVLGPAALLDWRLGDPLTGRLARRECEGRAGENLLVGNNGKLGSDWVLFLGGGSWEDLDADGFRSLLQHAFRVCRQAGFRRIGLCLAPPPGMTREGVENFVRNEEAACHPKGVECLLSLEAA